MLVNRGGSVPYARAYLMGASEMASAAVAGAACSASCTLAASVSAISVERSICGSSSPLCRVAQLNGARRNAVGDGNVDTGRGHRDSDGRFIQLCAVALMLRRPSKACYPTCARLEAQRTTRLRTTAR